MMLSDSLFDDFEYFIVLISIFIINIGVCCFEYDCNLILLSFPNSQKIIMEPQLILKGCSIFTLKSNFYKIFGK